MIIVDKVDIFLISETKIDGTFPTSQFLINNCSNVYRLDRNDKGGGIVLFVKDNLITFLVSGFCFSEKTEIFCVELNLRKQKWLILCCYNKHKPVIKDHLLQIIWTMDSFCAIYHLKSLIKEPTCYKNPEKKNNLYRFNLNKFS